MSFQKNPFYLSNNRIFILDINLLPVKLEYQKNATKYDLCDFPSSPSLASRCAGPQAQAGHSRKKKNIR